jgi:predicted O-methyltransferase YrrM
MELQSLFLSVDYKTPESHKEAASLPPEEQLLRQSTVTQYLAHLNSAAEMQKNHEGYITSLLPTDDIAIYKKADI